MKNRTEWVMHVWGRKRDSLELNGVEKFHLDMMKKMSKKGNQQKMMQMMGGMQGGMPNGFGGF